MVGQPPTNQVFCYESKLPPAHCGWNPAAKNQDLNVRAPISDSETESEPADAPEARGAPKGTPKSLLLSTVNFKLLIYTYIY